LNDLHAVASDDVRQKRWRRGFTFGQQHGSNVEFTREQPVNYAMNKTAVTSPDLLRYKEQETNLWKISSPICVMLREHS
jgi:hypothetical protein